MLLVVKHDFKAQSDEELTVNAGDILQLASHENDGDDTNQDATKGWSFVEKFSASGDSNRYGWIPSSYVEKMSESDFKQKLQSNDKEVSQLENESSVQAIINESNEGNISPLNSGGHIKNNSELDFNDATLTSHLSPFTDLNMDQSQLLASVDPLAATLDPLKFQEHSQPPKPPYGLRFQGFIKQNLDPKQSSSYAYHKIVSNTKEMDRLPSLSQTVKQEEHNELSRRHREYYNRMVENYAESSDILNNVCEQLDGKIIRSAADLDKYCRKVKELDEMLDQERKKWKQQYELEAVRSLNPSVRTTRENKSILGSPERTSVSV